MKQYHKLFLLSLAAVTTVACQDLEDRDYYSLSKTNENAAIVSTELSCVDYIRSRQDLSTMSSLFEATGVYTKMAEQGSLHTLLLVTNEHFDVDLATAYDSTFMANSHVTDIAVAPSKLNSGDKLLMWHEKNVEVTFDEQADETIIGHMYFNNAALEEVISTPDGYIYVISEPIQTPTSLQDFINSLSDDYSIFKDMVLSSGGKTFDKANSKVTGVDAQGNTVYDTVWAYTNDFFDAKDFDLSSEALTATMFYASDDVINDALKEADQKLRAWGIRSGSLVTGDYVEGRSDSLLKVWFLKAAFYKKKYSTEALTPQTVEEGGDETVNDLSSIYSIQWRTSVQELDLNNPTELSNGVAYEVSKLTFPGNALIYRIKEWFYYYDYCDADQKAEYFAMTNLSYSKTNVDVAAWTPLAGVWPTIEDRVLILKQTDSDDKTFTLDFTPLSATAAGDGTYTIAPYMVPVGAYRLAMGFKQNLGVTLRIIVYAVDGEDLTELGRNDAVLTDSSVGTTYHYDRGATLSNTYPEGYDKNDAAITDSKKQNYDTDGGLIISELNVQHADPTDDTPVRLLIRIQADNVGTVTSYTFNHWCLRPTANNY